MTSLQEGGTDPSPDATPGAARPERDALRARAMACLVAGVGILGFAAIFAAWAQEAGPGAIGFHRMLLALPFVVFLAWRQRGDRAAAGLGASTPAQVRRARRWAMLAGLSFTTDLVLWHTAMTRTSAANATLLVGLAPLWVNLAAVAFLGMRLRASAWTGLVLALGGAAVLSLAKGARFGGGGGEVLAFLASFGYAGYTLCLSRARAHLSAPEALAWAVPVCVLGFLGLALAFGNPLWGYGPRTWMALVGLGLVVQVAGWWLISWGLGHVEPGLASTVLLLQPVFTLFLAWPLLRQIPTRIQVLGSAFVVGGLWLVVARPWAPPHSGVRTSRSSR